MLSYLSRYLYSFTSPSPYHLFETKFHTTKCINVAYKWTQVYERLPSSGARVDLYSWHFSVCTARRANVQVKLFMSMTRRHMGYTYNPSRRQCRHCIEVRQHGWLFSSSKIRVFATFPDHTEPLPRTRNLTFFLRFTDRASQYIYLSN